MLVRVPFGLLAAAGILFAAAAPASAQRDDRFLFLEPARPAAPQPQPQPRPRRDEVRPTPPQQARPAPQPQPAPPQGPSSFFGGLFGFRRPDPPPVPPQAIPAPVETRRPVAPELVEPYGRRAPVERAFREPSDRALERRRIVARPAPAVRAPKAVVEKPKAVEPTTHVVVFGDSLGESLKDGLSVAYEDAVEIDVVDRTKPDSGLVRNDYYDWAKVVADYLNTNPKITVAVMMLGVNDRQPIREGDASHEPLSDRWRELYRDRVDTVVRLFGERRVPLVWVGAPPMRNEKASAETVALNDIFRERVQRAGGTYVDVWPGFVDDENRYAAVGPDTGGQTARLRANDGTHFTGAGARKAAFFVETELKRLLGRKDGAAVAALPAAPSPGEAGPRSGAPPPPGGADPIALAITASLPFLPEPPGLVPLAARPTEGPSVPLTRPDLSPGGTLMGARPRFSGDAAFVVDQALRNGVAPSAKPGRADDFTWPRS